MSSNHLKTAETLTQKLQELANENRPAEGKSRRSGDEIATDQIAVFGELLLKLARYLDGAQQNVIRLTWAILALTAVMAVLAILQAWPA